MAALELYADVACPFAHLGLHRLVDERRRRGRDDLALWVRPWPLELVNGEPLAPDAVAAEIEALRAAVAPELFRGFDAASFPSTTLPALALAGAAYRVSDALGERVSVALRDAVFEQGLDVGDTTVLDTMAAYLGVPAVTDADRAQVLVDYEEGRQRGVRGSPEFFVHGTRYFCPALDIRHVEGRLEIELDAASFEAFVADCMML